MTGLAIRSRKTVTAIVGTGGSCPPVHFPLLSLSPAGKLPFSHKVLYLPTDGLTNKDYP